MTGVTRAFCCGCHSFFAVEILQTGNPGRDADMVEDIA